MPHRRPRKRRHGMTNLLEAIISITLFGSILVMLLSLLAYMTGWNAKVNSNLETKLDTDYLVEELVCDVKSAETAEVLGEKLQLVRPDEVVTYSVVEKTLYRNDKRVIDGISSFMFIPGAGDTVGIYLVFNDGRKIDMTVHR